MFWQRGGGGGAVFGKWTFPGWFSQGRHVFSQRPTAGKHMASFRRAAATCVTDRPRKYKDCKRSCAENAQYALGLFTFYLRFGSGSREAPARTRRTWTEARRKPSVHTCVSAESHAVLLLQSQYLADFTPSVFSPLWESERETGGSTIWKNTAPSRCCCKRKHSLDVAAACGGGILDLVSQPHTE